MGNPKNSKSYLCRFHFKALRNLVYLPLSIFLSNHFFPEPTNLVTYPTAKTTQELEIRMGELGMHLSVGPGEEAQRKSSLSCLPLCHVLEYS